MINEYQHPIETLPFEPKPFVFVMLKPLGANYELASEISARLGEQAQQVYGLRVTADYDRVAAHYGLAANEPYYRPIVEYLSGQTVEIGIYEDIYGRSGAEFISDIRGIVGKFNPLNTQTDQLRHIALRDHIPYLRVMPGEGRQYCYDNLVHTSDSVASAAREIGIWFDCEPEVVDRYTQYHHLLSNEL